MNIPFRKRLLSFLLVVAIALGLVSAVTVLRAEAETATKAAETLDASKPEIVALRDYAQNLPWPVAVKTMGLTTSSAMTGHWMILVAKGSDGTMVTVNMSSQPSICVENNATDPRYLYGVTYVTNQGAVPELHSMPQAHVLSFSGTGASFTIQNYKKSYWYINNINHGNTNTDYYDFTFTGDSNSAAKFKIITNGAGYNLQSTAGIYVRPNGSTFQVGPTHWGNPIHFYKFSDYTINLRLSMLDALPYLIDNTNDRFNATAHSNLMAAMAAAVDAYQIYYGTKESDLSAATKTELQNLNTNLQNAIAAVKDGADPFADLRNKINSALWPYADGMLGSRDNITAGRYMILAERDGAMEPLYGVNSDANPDGWVGDSDAHITRAVEPVLNDVYGLVSNSANFYSARPTSQRPIVILSGSGSSCTIQHYNGLYWNITNNTHWYSDRPSPTTWSDFYLSRTPTTFWINDGNLGFTYRICCTVGSVTNIIVGNGHTFRAKTRPTDQSAAVYNLYFYKFNDEALDLRLALQEGLDYLIEDYATRYDEASIDALCKKLYEVYYKFDTQSEVVGMRPYAMTEAKKQEYVRLRNEIYDAIAQLKLADSTLSYIDLPIEVLDFRGDGFLFESLNTWSSPYSLTNKAVDINSDRFPGHYVRNVANNTNSDNFQIEGLVEKELVGGKVVYTKKTVDYIAYHLSQKTDLKTPTDKSNGIFYAMVNAGLPYDAEDGYAATIAKTDTGAPGGKLLWEDVKTAHDLAYYMLSYMWAESKEAIGKDSYANNTTADVSYNISVPELSHIRLFKTGDAYSYDATTGYSTYDYGYIYNDSTPRTLMNPRFQPLNGKGFETAEQFGQLTEGSADAFATTGNYHFTIHAYGAFVYSEGANQFIEFGGDDDVYIFINDRLVCDAGGVHGMIRKRVYLSEIAKEQGLKDGDVCRFDMFHAERHLTGINFALNTNIELMDESLVAEKEQYDPEIQKPIMDGTAIESGAEIGYAFSLLNRSSGPAKNISFADELLHIALDSETGTAVLNAAADRFVGEENDGLCLVYSTYDSGTRTVADGPVQTLESLQEITTIIDAAASDTPLKAGVYRYYLSSIEELQQLLALGVPASCKLTIRGIRHTLSQESLFVNSLTVKATPYDDKGVALEPVFSAASCRVTTMTLGAVSVNDPYAVVLDFGNSVDLDLTKIAASLTPASGVQISYVGATFNGSHGTVKPALPANLTFTVTGNHHETDTGYYAMQSDTVLRFTPKNFLDKGNSFYAVYKVTASSGDYYIMKEVTCLPATSVYYETDFGEPSVFRYGRSDGILINFGYGDAGNWKYDNVRITSTKTGGVLKGTIDASTGDPYAVMTNSPYNYLVKPGDVVKVRIKSDLSTGMGLQVFFATDKTTTLNGTPNICTENGEYTPNGKWQTITLPIKETVYGQTVKAIRIDPSGYNEEKVSGNYEVDWVYIGPDDAFNTPILLDFGPEDTTAWTANKEKASVKKENGVLKVTTTGAEDPRVEMTSASCTLKRVVGEDDVVLMRLRSPIGSGTGGMEVYFLTDTNDGANSEISTYQVGYTPNGEWQIVEFEIKPEVIGKQIIGLRLDQLTLPAASATFEYDWVYVGPKQTAEKELFSYVSTDEAQPWELLGSADQGQQQAKLPDAEVTYGYDPVYAADTIYSGNSRYFVEGVGVPMLKYRTDENEEYILDAEGERITFIDYKDGEAYTEVAFPFTGTGFDIISRTGADQGSLRVVVCDPDGNVKKTVTVINKGTTELRQIPVVSVKDLDYGTYTVHIFVNAAYDYNDDGDADIFGGALDRGGEFYFDAVRIYNPIDTNATDENSAFAYSAYQAHGEADPIFTEVRQMLIDASKDASSDELEGVAYFDTAKGTTNNIAEYTAGGPNNEVYLASGNAISFKLEVTGAIPASVDIGAKSADGVPVSMTAKIGTSASETKSISTATELYYPLAIASDAWQTSDGKSYVYVTISNSGTSGILSITNIKYAYGASAQTLGLKSMRFLVDAKMLDKSGTACEHVIAYTNNGENHTVVCENCVYSATEAHDFVDGSCVCGAVEVTEPTVDSNISIGETLSLESDLTMNLRIKTSQLTAYDLSTAYLVVERDVYNSNGTMEVETRTLTEYTIKDNRLVFAYTGISAAQMNDEIRAVLYIKDSSGKEYVSNEKVTSVAIYSDLMLGASAGNEKLITLIMDMLNYGTAAQIYFNRHADAPVNEAFESFKTYASYASSDLKAALEDMSGTISNGNSSATVTQGLDLSTRVGITYKVKLPAGVDAANASVIIKDADGNELESFDLSTGTVDSNGRYCVTFFGSTSRDMRRVVYATVMVNGEAISNTYTYTISSYAHTVANTAGMPEALVNLTKLMVIYGDSADAYFA